jgi:flagellin-like protein
LIKTINVTKTTKFKRSIKAISPVIATLLMIAIAVVASLVVYAWVTGYIGGTTSTAGKAIQIQSMAVNQDGNLVVYVQNVGQGAVELKPSESLYVNSVLVPFTANQYTISEGNTLELTTTPTYSANDKVSIKVTTTDGTFMTATGTVKQESPDANPTAPPDGDNISPTAAFTSVASDLSVTFTDTSTDSDGTIASWSWNFGDSVTSTEQNPTHVYASANTYTVSLTVTDNNGASSNPIATQDVTVTQAAPQTIILRPKGQGNSENLAANPSNTGWPSYNAIHNWEDVDETTSDGSSTYVYSTSSTEAFDTYVLQNSGITTGTITQITVHIIAEISGNNNGGAGTAREYIRIGGSNYNNPNAHSLNTNYVEYSYNWATNPNTNSAWTWTNIDALEAGVGLTQSGGYSSYQTRCTQVWIEVTYIP